MIGARTSLVVLSCIASLAASARAETDFSPGEGRWNGIGRFVALAEDEGVSLRVVGELDARALAPSDAVILLDVTPSRTVARLSAFVERGGTLVIADESPSVDPLLERLGFRRYVDAGEGASGVPAREGLYVATPRLAHPLVEGVDWLVTNLPRPFVHERLAPIVALDDDRHLVSIGRLGDGELVVVGDASLFIDQMIALDGNERFARNLARQLAGRDEVLVVRGPGRVLGAPLGSSDRSRMGELRDALARLSTIPSTPLALHFTAVFALCGLVIALASRFARAEAFRGPRRLSLAGLEGGVAGRARLPRAHWANLRGHALVYRRTLFEGLSTMLDAELKTATAVEAALVTKGASPRLAREARMLVARLDAVQRDRDHRVSRRAYESLVERGERLLEAASALARTR